MRELAIMRSIVICVWLMTFSAKVSALRMGGALLTAQNSSLNASAAHGIAHVTISDNSVHFIVAASGLSGPITKAYIYETSSSSIESILFILCNPCSGNYLFGTWQNASVYISDFASNLVFINVQTELNPDGEIRGQFAVQPPTGPPFIGGALLSGAYPARGIASVRLSPDGRDLLFNIVATNLSGPIATARFHLGAPGSSAPDVDVICSPCAGNYLSGRWANASKYTRELAAGNVSLSLDTALNPAGEIGGWLTLNFPPPVLPAASAPSPSATPGPFHSDAPTPQTSGAQSTPAPSPNGSPATCPAPADETCCTRILRPGTRTLRITLPRPAALSSATIWADDDSGGPLYPPSGPPAPAGLALGVGSSESLTGCAIAAADPGPGSATANGTWAYAESPAPFAVGAAAAAAPPPPPGFRAWEVICGATGPTVVLSLPPPPPARRVAVKICTRLDGGVSARGTLWVQA